MKPKSVLVVVDYQTDFVNGTLGFPEAAALEPGICKKIADCRKKGYDLLFTLDTHTPDYLDTQEGRRLPVVHCIKNTAGWRLYGRAAELARSEELLEKPSFGSLALAEILQEKKYNKVELVGLVSNICVLSNALIAKAALPEAEVIVDASLIAAPDPSIHQKALDLLEGVQVTVINRTK